jgi:hypothetical protein
LLLIYSLAIFYMVPIDAALIADTPGQVDMLDQPAEEPAKVAPIDCVRQAATPRVTTTTAPQFVCRAKTYPGNCHAKPA